MSKITVDEAIGILQMQADDLLARAEAILEYDADNVNPQILIDGVVELFVHLCNSRLELADFLRDAYGNQTHEPPARARSRQEKIKRLSKSQKQHEEEEKNSLYQLSESIELFLRGEHNSMF